MRPRGALAILASAQLLIALDHNIVYVALPQITAALAFERGAEQWVVSAYALAFGGALLAGGGVTDVVGPRRVFVAALWIHAAAAALGGIAGAPAVLIAARAAQGLGSALLFPATLAALNQAFPGPERVRALAVWGAAGAGGGAFGSLLGGVLAGWLGWRSVLLFAVPVAGAAALAGARVLPGGREAGGQHRRGAPGAVASPARGFGDRPWRQAPSAAAGTCAAALAVLTLGQGLAGGWPAAGVIGAALAATAAAALFWGLERRTRAPLIPRALLRRREVRAAAILAFAFMASFGGQFYLLSVHLQDGERLGALAAGVAFLPLTLAILAGTQAGGALAVRLGSGGAALLGLGAGALGLAGCGVAVARGSAPGLAAAMVLDGLGQGIAWTGMWALAAGAGGRHQGVATGVVATCQQVGGAAGLAVWVALAQTAASFLLAAVAVLAAAGAAAYTLRPGRMASA